MTIYISAFLITTLLVALGEKIKKFKMIIFVLALSIPCILAGLRDFNIGTDISVYTRPLAEAAIYSKSFTEYLNSQFFQTYKYVSVDSFEIGYTLFVYIVIKIFHSVSMVLFFTEVLIISPLFFVIRKNKQIFSSWVAILVYLFLFYNNSLNLMRQSIAVSFFILSYYYYKEKKFKTFIAWFLIGCSFHISCIMGLVVVATDLYLSPKIKSFSLRKRIFRVLTIIFMGFFAILASSYFSEVLVFLGLGRFSYYIVGDIDFMPNQILIRLPLLLMIIYNWKEIDKKHLNNIFLLTVNILEILAGQFVSISSFSSRIGFYFSIFNVLIIPTIISGTFVVMKEKSFLSRIILACYLIFYFWFYYVNRNNGLTVPYKFI